MLTNNFDNKNCCRNSFIHQKESTHSMLARLTLLSLPLLLNACTTNQTLAGSDLNDKIRNSIVTVVPVNNPAMLAERTKAQAVVKFVATTAISSIASSGNVNTKPGDFKAFQKAANDQMEMGKMLNQQLQKSMPDSYKVALGAGADVELAQKMSEYYQSKHNPQAVNQLYVSISAPLWELGYVSFLTSQNYALNYQFTISLYESIDGKDKVLNSSNCIGKVETEMPLESWKNDNYSLVNIEAEKIVDKCYHQFVAYLG